MTVSLEIQMGLEKALSLQAESMRYDRRWLEQILKAWRPEYGTDVGAVERVNKAGYTLFLSASAFERGLALFTPLIETRGYQAERDELEKVWELLGSWDLHTHFGWNVE